MEKTLGIIKPNAVKRNLVGAILEKAESSGLKVKALKMVHLTKAQAEGFYYVHKERPFFDSLTTFMSEGPIVLVVFEADNAISTWREVMGATDPAKAAEGTIRKLYGESVERNSSHGSDSPSSAEFEIGYFFGTIEQVG
ncbi:MAG: nucleoside-diphosphate kinase [Acidobacteriota bacterium]|jgi:nucleoside-diphosphate kinase